MFDRTLSSAENLLALINQDNQSNLTFDDVVFDTVLSSDGTNNTQVTIRNVKNSEDTVVVTYDRLQLSTVIPGPVYVTRSEGLDDTGDVRDAIAKHYAFVLDADDVVTEPIDASVTAVTLKAASSSLAWIGELSVTLLNNGESVFNVNDNDMLHVDEDNTLTVG